MNPRPNNVVFNFAAAILEFLLGNKILGWWFFADRNTLNYAKYVALFTRGPVYATDFVNFVD